MPVAPEELPYIHAGIGCHTWQDQGFQHCNLRRTPDGGALLMPHHRNKTSEIITGFAGKGRGLPRSLSVVSQSWHGVVKLAVVTGVAYFLAGRLGLALRAEPGVAVFWPAAGIAVGALVALGPSARLPVAAAVVVATTACNLMIGRNAWMAIAFGTINAGQPLLTAWLLERWFGSRFKLEDVQRVLGFLVASAIGSAIAAVGAAISVQPYRSDRVPSARVAALVCGMLTGVVTVAPLLIGLGDVLRERLTRHELVEGWAGRSSHSLPSVHPSHSLCRMDLGQRPCPRLSSFLFCYGLPSAAGRCSLPRLHLSWD